MKRNGNEDVQDIPRLIRAMYECISGPAGAPRDWARFRFLHRPEALSLRTVVQPDGSTRADVFTQDEYIADVEPFFAANDFYEIDIAHRIEQLRPGRARVEPVRGAHVAGFAGADSSVAPTASSSATNRTAGGWSVRSGTTSAKGVRFDLW